MHVLISKVNQSSCNFDIHEPIEAGTITYLHQNIGSEKDFNELLTNTLPLPHHRAVPLTQVDSPRPCMMCICICLLACNQLPSWQARYSTCRVMTDCELKSSSCWFLSDLRWFSSYLLVVVGLRESLSSLILP